MAGTANPAVVSQVRADVDAAARTLGRDPHTVGVVVGAVTVVDRDGVAARALARRKVALYLPIIAQLDHTLQIEPDLLSCVFAYILSLQIFNGGSVDEVVVSCYGYSILCDDWATGIIRLVSNQQSCAE